MQKKSRKKTEVDIADLYAVKPGALWSGLKQQHISFWLLCFYYFVEYARLQTLYPVLDIIPWGQVSILAVLITVFFDSNIRWVSSPINKLYVLFYVVVIISGIFAFMPGESWNQRNLMLTWILVHYLTINIVNNEKKLVIFVVAYLLFNLKMSQHGAIT